MEKGDVIYFKEDQDELNKIFKTRLILWGLVILFFSSPFLLEHYWSEVFGEDKPWGKITHTVLLHIATAFLVTVIVDISTHRIFKINIIKTVSRLFKDHMPKEAYAISNAGISDCKDKISGDYLFEEMEDYLKLNGNKSDRVIKCIVFYFASTGSDSWFPVFEKLVMLGCKIEIVLPSYRVLNNALLIARASGINSSDQKLLITQHASTISSIKHTLAEIIRKEKDKPFLQKMKKKLLRRERVINNSFSLHFHNSYITFPQLHFAGNWYQGYYFQKSTGDNEFVIKASDGGALANKLQDNYDVIKHPSVSQLEVPDLIKAFKITRAKPEDIDWIFKGPNNVLDINLYPQEILDYFATKIEESIQIIRDGKNDRYGFILILPLQDTAIPTLKRGIKDPATFINYDWNNATKFVIENIFVFDQYFQESMPMYERALHQIPDLAKRIFKSRSTNSIEIYSYGSEDNNLRNEVIRKLRFQETDEYSEVYKISLEKLQTNLRRKND